MTRRPSGKKPSGPEGPPRELPPGSTEASRLLILVEQMQGRFEVVVDDVTQMRRELKETREELRREFKSDMSVLTIAVRQNSKDILKNSEDIRKNTEEIRKNSEDIRKNSEDIQKNSEDIQKNSEGIRRLSDRLDVMVERAQLVRLEQRVTVLEQRAGISP